MPPDRTDASATPNESSGLSLERSPVDRPATGIPEVDELLRLEPRLQLLLDEVERVEDDKTSSFFCSNYVWLPVNTRLRLLLGVARTRRPGGEDPPVLYDSRAYERVFEHLSRRLPPCRDCGCRLFRRQREEA